MSDVVLINAPVRDTEVDGQAGMSPPLGIAYIAAVLEDSGFQVSVTDFNLSGWDADRLIRALKRERPSILGLSAHTGGYPTALEIARLAKEFNPEVSVVIGGPHASVMHKDVILEPDIDFVVRGEGEYTMLELAQCLLRADGDLGEISGLVYKFDGEVRVNPERPFIADPDELPYPAKDLLPLELYRYPGNVLASRGGCPFNCAFCAVNNIWQGDRRFRTPANVGQEILGLFGALGIREINFADDTFTLSRARTLELCAVLKALPVPYQWTWTCATRVDLVDAELLEVMRDAGCTTIQLGAETGSQEVMDATGKRITLAQVRTAVGLARGLGMDVLCSFMLPHPDDTEATIYEQARFMKELSAMGAKLSMAFTIPFPGTYYYEHAEELGIKILSDDWADFDARHLNITTRNLSEDRLRALADELVEKVGLLGG